MSIFTYRGPLHPSSQNFYGREEELSQLKMLCEGDVTAYSIIYGARQVGKTSLLLRLKSSLPVEKFECCKIDFQSLPRASSGEVYQYIAYQVANIIDSKYPEKSAISPVELENSLSRDIKLLGRKKLVLLIEELGALPPLVRCDLANVFRSFFTNRYKVIDCPLSRLMVVFAGSIEMYDLATKDLSPLNNICESIYLSDLTENDAKSLIRNGLEQLKLPSQNADFLANKVFEEVKGYPYLTQRIGGYLENQILRGNEVSAISVEKATEMLLSEDPLIRHIFTTLKEEDLFLAVKELTVKKIPFSRIDSEMARLELVGMVKQSDNYWEIRNLLLERAVKKWLESVKNNEKIISREAINDLVTIGEFLKLIVELRTMLKDARLDKNKSDEIEKRITAIEEQAKIGKTKGSTITGSLQDIATVISAVATTSTSVQQIIPLIQKAIQWAGQIYH